MSAPRPWSRVITVSFMAFWFGLGLGAGWWMHDRSAPDVAVRREPVPLPIATTGAATVPPPAPPSTVTQPGPETVTLNGAVARLQADPVAELRNRELQVPIDGLNVERMKGSFAEGRDKGSRPHEAADILAPRGTPIRAVEGGTIAKLFISKAGGNTVYQFDKDQRYCYYYAHLDRYANGLREGMAVAEGDVIGYVGTSGNAPPQTPHLHFAIFQLTVDRHWWEGTALDPYLVYSDRAPG